jgi:hypothetical protein
MAAQAVSDRRKMIKKRGKSRFIGNLPHQKNGNFSVGGLEKSKNVVYNEKNEMLQKEEGGSWHSG